MNAKIKNLVKSAVLGVAVLGGAIAMQSFTEAHRANRLAGEIYVNTTDQGDYEKLPSSEPYNSTNCEERNDHTCSWVRTSTPGTVPDQFTAEEAEQLEADDLIEKMENKNGIYVR